jgi:hypothetical protein
LVISISQLNDLLIQLIVRACGARLEQLYLLDCPTKLSRVSLDVLVTQCPRLRVLQCNSFPSVRLD